MVNNCPCFAYAYGDITIFFLRTSQLTKISLVWPNFRNMGNTVRIELINSGLLAEIANADITHGDPFLLLLLLIIIKQLSLN